MTKCTVKYDTIDLLEYDATIPTGYLDWLTTGPSIPKPLLIRNWWHYMAVFEYGLSDCRVYKTGYLDKVMVSGINEAGERVHVFFQKTYARGKYARKRRQPTWERLPDIVVQRVSDANIKENN